MLFLSLSFLINEHKCERVDPIFVTSVSDFKCSYLTPEHVKHLTDSLHVGLDEQMNNVEQA